jgi:hypothetical protein
MDPAGRIEVIYVHHDGYLTGVGKTLLDDYSSEEDAIQLIVDGGRDSLYAKDDKRLVTENNLFYDSKRMFTDLDALSVNVTKRRDIEYVYIWKDDQWHWFKNGELESLKGLIPKEVSFKIGGKYSVQC